MSEAVLKTDKFPTNNAALRFFEIALVLVHLDHGHSHLSICVVERNDAFDASVAMWRATYLEQ